MLENIEILLECIGLEPFVLCSEAKLEQGVMAGGLGLDPLPWRGMMLKFNPLADITGTLRLVFDVLGIEFESDFGGV